jgi:uncharacterized membrane protein YccC
MTILDRKWDAEMEADQAAKANEIDIERRILVARHVAFVIRCSLAASLSYLIASAIGLEHPIWAAMSGIIVSQESLEATRRATIWRIAGTLVGICVAVAAGSLLDLLAAPTALQIGVGVALCSILARRWPDLKVAMWTAPIVYLTIAPGISLTEAGLWRGLEVLVGGAVGALLHWLAEIAISGITSLHRRR